MQRNAFSSKDTFRDAPIEDDVLNFPENQRLQSDILTRERHNYYKEKRKREAERGGFLSAVLREISLYCRFLSTLRHILRKNSKEPMQKTEMLRVSRDLFFINSSNGIFLQTFLRRR